MTMALERNKMTTAVASPRRQGLARRMYRRVVRSMEISRRKRMLDAMPDYLLKDIGISRSDIDAVVEAMVDGREDATRLRRFG